MRRRRHSPACPASLPQEVTQLFRHRDEAVADSANQRRQLLEVQGMGAWCHTLRSRLLFHLANAGVAPRLVPLILGVPHNPTHHHHPPTVLLHMDMAAKHDSELGQAWLRGLRGAAPPRATPFSLAVSFMLAGIQRFEQPVTGAAGGARFRTPR